MEELELALYHCLKCGIWAKIQGPFYGNTFAEWCPACGRPGLEYQGATTISEKLPEAQET